MPGWNPIIYLLVSLETVESESKIKIDSVDETYEVRIPTFNGTNDEDFYISMVYVNNSLRPE